MSDQVDYTDGNYVSLSIEELPYERADENDYHLKMNDEESPLEDAVPLLVPLVASIPKTKRRHVKKTKELVKKKSKKNKKTRGTSKLVVKPRTLVTKSGEPLRANLSRR